MSECIDSPAEGIGGNGGVLATLVWIAVLVGVWAVLQ